jgi:hypothetical protein
LNKRAAQAVLTVIFVGLLVAVAALNKRTGHNATPEANPVVDPKAIERYGFKLTEASKSSGIDFTHKAAAFDPKLAHIMEEVSAMGAAVAVVDFDKDGFNDLYVTNSGEGSKNHLYRNLGNGTFEDVAEKVGLADVNQLETGVSMGSVWGDFDNDGYEDCFLYKYGRPELYRNVGGKKFELVPNAGMPPWLNANSACWLDYDCDGKLDLFVGGYFREDLNLWKLTTTAIMTDSFEYSENGGRKWLFHNLGGGKFEDVAEKLGIKSNRWALAVIAADLRGTGYPDIFIANDYGKSEIFANDGGKGFHPIGDQALYWSTLGGGPKSGMNASFGDVLNSGRLSVYVSNISEEGVLIQGNNLWMPVEGKTGDQIQFENQANAMGVELGGWSFGAQFGDLNNDGALDLYLVNGYVSADPQRSYWYDFTKVASGHSSIIGDAKNWPALGGRSHAGYQQKKLWINDGAGKFRDVAVAVGASDTYDGRSIVMADFDNDGQLDVVVANQRGPLLLYRNQVTPDNAWVELELEGVQSNRSAIGAQVRVFWNGQQQLQEVSGGSGFCAQNMRRLHFGLGRHSKIDRIEIRWPSGKTQTLTDAVPGKIVKVKEAA